MEGRREVRGRDDPGKDLDGPDRISLRHARNGPELGQIEVTHGHPPYLLEACPLTTRRRLDVDSRQLDGAPLESNVDLDGLAQANQHILRVLDVSEARNSKGVRTRGDGRDAV